MNEVIRVRQRYCRLGRRLIPTVGAIAALGLAGPAAATLPVGSQLRVSTTGADGSATLDAQNPDVAYNQREDQYLVVWEADTTDEELEIWGRLHRADGTPVGAESRITDVGTDADPAFDAVHPAVSYNRRADEYVVVYEATVTPGPDEEKEIFAQRLSSAGARVGTPVRVSQMGADGNPAFDALNPAIAYNALTNTYTVAWHGDDGEAPLVDDEYEIYVQRLAADLSEVGPNDLRVSDMGPDGNAAFSARNASIAANEETGEDVVVWEGDDNTAPLVDDEQEIYLQRLSAAGAETGPNDVRISDMGPDGNAAFDAANPVIAWNGRSNEFMIAWQGDDDRAPLVDDELEIFGQRVTAAGVEVGGNDVRVSDMGPNGDTTFPAVSPAVSASFRANEYLVTWSGAESPGELEIHGQRLDAAGAEIGTNDFRISSMGPDGDAAFDASSPAVAFGAIPNEYLVTWHGDTGPPLADDELEIYARRSGADTPLAPQAAVCKTVQAPTAPKGDPSRVTLSRNQLLINQRISQAAVHRANAIQSWIEAGIQGRDICGGALDQAEFGPSVRLGFLPDSTPPGSAAPRSVTPMSPGGGNPARVALSRRQLLINQRISQAAVRRANALKARLDAGLAGGDVTDGTIGADGLQFGLGVLVATPTATQVETSTRVAPFQANAPGRVRLSREQLLINQRISQAAVLRTNAIRARLESGLSAAAFQNGTLTSADLAPAIRP